MTAFCALVMLYTSYLTLAVVSAKAVFFHCRYYGASLLLSLSLFFTLMVIKSMLWVTNEHILASHAYGALFVSSVIEECLKGFCLLLYCHHQLTITSMVSQPIGLTSIWPFALIVALVENSKIFAAPLLTSILHVSELSLYEWDPSTIPAIQFYTASGMTVLTTTLFTRIAAHYFLAWLFVYFWLTNKKHMALGIACAHGMFNMTMLWVRVTPLTVLNEALYISCIYLLFSLCLYLFTHKLTQARRHSLSSTLDRPH